MRSHGAIAYLPAKRSLEITVPAQTALILKRVVSRIDKGEFGKLHLSVTDENCRDLSWFLSRYPMQCTVQATDIIRTGAANHRQMQADLEQVSKLANVTTRYPLALPMREYQAKGVAVYLKRKGLLVADTMGLGKTIIGIGSFTDPKTLPALIVCQTHLTFQWQAECAKFLPQAKTHIVKTGKLYSLPDVPVFIVTYSKLAKWGETLAERMRSIVLDEVQEMRTGSKADKYNAALHIRSKCDYALGLSGTPVINYGGEIYNVMNLLLPGALGTQQEFAREHCDYRGDKLLLKEPQAFGAYLRDEYMMLRRTRQELGMQLPQVQRIIQTIPYDAKVIDSVQDSANELARLVLEGSFIERGAAARQLDLRMRQATGVSKSVHVAEFVRMLVEDGEKVVLMGWHRAVFDVWMNKLADLNPLLFSGSESPKQKRAAQMAFQHGDCKVLIMSLRSGAGVDGLQLASKTMVFGELDWSRNIHEQGLARLNRDGLIGGVTAYFLVSDAGSDPLVAEILQLKESQSRPLLDPDAPLPIENVQSADERMKRLARACLARKKTH